MSRLIRALPNLFTLANLTCGVFSLVFIVNEALRPACFLIFAAAVFDFLDGKVARKLKATSEFGVTLDSLADLVTFGVVPALCLYEAFPHGVLAHAALVIFPAAGALRLARFNTKPTVGYFEGLPITAAGVIIGAMILLWPSNGTLIASTAIVLSALMVSKLRVQKL